MRKEKILNLFSFKLNTNKYERSLFIRNFYYKLAPYCLVIFLITIFLTLNGHIVALEVVGMSYQQIPIGYGIDFETVAKAGVTAGKDMFSQTLTIAFPIVAVLLLISITVGVITRSAPQLNLFSFGFPLTLISVFIILYLNTESLAFGMHDMIMDTLEKLKLIFGEKS